MSKHTDDRTGVHYERINIADNSRFSSVQEENLDASQVSDVTSEEVESNKIVSELKGLLDLANSLGEQLADVSKIFSVEVALAIQQMPKLLFNSLATILCTLLFWLSFSFTVSFVVYELTTSVVYAAASFTFLQVILFCTLHMMRKSYYDRMKFRYTKESLNELLEAVKQ
jgi:hypothetical protein